MSKSLNHKQVVSLIKAIGASRTVLVEGEAGIGKTAMLYEFRNDPAFAGYHIIDPIDCTQLSDGSVWMPDIDRENGISRELPNERFGVSKSSQKGINGSKPIIICLDEIAKATRVPLNTVRSRLGLAKKALRAAIERDPVLCEELDELREANR